MGSPLGPLIANAFVCKIEKQLEKENKMPFFCKRYVDDTISAMVDVKIASEFLMTLNSSHPSIGFTMGLEENGRLPFLLILLHYHSHIDTRCSRLRGGFFTRNVNASKGIFRLRYPDELVRSTIRRFTDLTWKPVSELSHTHGVYLRSKKTHLELCCLLKIRNLETQYEDSLLTTVASKTSSENYNERLTEIVQSLGIKFN